MCQLAVAGRIEANLHIDFKSVLLVLNFLQFLLQLLHLLQLSSPQGQSFCAILCFLFIYHF